MKFTSATSTHIQQMEDYTRETHTIRQNEIKQNSLTITTILQQYPRFLNFEGYLVRISITFKICIHRCGLKTHYSRINHVQFQLDVEFQLLRKAPKTVLSTFPGDVQKIDAYCKKVHPDLSMQFTEVEDGENICKNTVKLNA